MTSAALATGNAVLLKPAEQSPALAFRLVQALRAGGVPPAAIALLPGEGDVGAALVAHRDVQAIAFTGSLAVGREIVSRAAQLHDGQRHFKQVVAELGGKNCVIVAADADLDEAVPGIVGSAFNYAGQKCSAASRVLVHEAIADQLIERLAGAVRTLVVGQADSLGTDVPPVIECEAQERVRRYEQAARDTGRVVAQAEPPSDDGWFCPATLAADLPDGSPVLEEEIFGPLLAVQRVRDVEDACDVVDGGRQPVRQPRDHGGDGGAPAVRRQPAVGDRAEGRRAGLPAPVRRAARAEREHDAPRPRGVSSG
jgi:RHH-type proline utilization regulon transcriptional repressor/proline dehydrogenase/delta 1-pyrroline-5-carboxylate dehydrogenase